jgi:hypothetical protein
MLPRADALGVITAPSLWPSDNGNEKRSIVIAALLSGWFDADIESTNLENWSLVRMVTIHHRRHSIGGCPCNLKLRLARCAAGSKPLLQRALPTVKETFRLLASDLPLSSVVSPFRPHPLAIVDSPRFF